MRFQSSRNPPSTRLPMALIGVRGNKARAVVDRGWLAFVALCVATCNPAFAQHACDDLGERGWATVATLETVARSEGKPFRSALDGNWYIERKTTLLPFCNYYNSIGNYSLRSYSLSPEDKVERVEICHTLSPGAIPTAVAPYAGACPPG